MFNNWIGILMQLIVITTIALIILYKIFRKKKKTLIPDWLFDTYIINKRRWN